MLTWITMILLKMAKMIDSTTKWHSISRDSPNAKMIIFYTLTDTKERFNNQKTKRIKNNWLQAIKALNMMKLMKIKMVSGKP